MEPLKRAHASSAIAGKWARLARNRGSTTCLTRGMDGLRAGSDILFVLTTKRPEQLEVPSPAGQAIEVPLPDETGRGKLIRLFGRGLPLEPTSSMRPRGALGACAARCSSN